MAGFHMLRDVGTVDLARELTCGEMVMLVSDYLEDGRAPEARRPSRRTSGLRQRQPYVGQLCETVRAEAWRDALCAGAPAEPQGAISLSTS